jgi:hypothetical protein
MRNGDLVRLGVALKSIIIILCLYFYTVWQCSTVGHTELTIVSYDKFLDTDPGTDVMIFEIFSPKNLTKKLAAFAQSAASFYNNLPNPNTGF